MDKIKKQFKDFWAYYRLLRYGANSSNKGEYKRILPLGFIFAIGIVNIIPQITVSIYSANIFVFLCIMAVSTGLVTSYRPSLIGVSPFTPRQRVIFSYLATLIRAIVITVIWMAFLAAITLLIALIAFVFSGENIFITEESAPHVAARVVCACGRAHEVLFWLILAFSMYAISHLNSNKARIISAVCFFVGLEILALGLVNACEFARQGYDIASGINDGLIESFFLFSDVPVTVEYLAHPWVVPVVEACLTAAAFAASLYTSVMRYKSGKI
ncbi:MAG: hypothetical protein NC131_01350 [Roseburia sp.]|nr:hypothetical protein [Roseburia sp.]